MLFKMSDFKTPFTERDLVFLYFFFVPRRASLFHRSFDFSLENGNLFASLRSSFFFVNYACARGGCMTKMSGTASQFPVSGQPPGR